MPRVTKKMPLAGEYHFDFRDEPLVVTEEDVARLRGAGTWPIEVRLGNEFVGTVTREDFVVSGPDADVTMSVNETADLDAVEALEVVPCLMVEKGGPPKAIIGFLLTHQPVRPIRKEDAK